MTATEHLPGLLRYYRTAAGRTVRELAEATFVSVSHASNLEHGRRVPTVEWAATADAYLGGKGQLVTAWRLDQVDRDRRARLAQHVTATDATASELLVLPDAVDLDAMHGQVADLAVAYLHSPPDEMLAAIRGTYDELARRLREDAYRPHEQRELLIALGRASGVLAYATLDIGRPASAIRHAEVAYRMGVRAEHGELAAWARGTSSLVARFERHYDRAQAYVVDGLRYATQHAGTAGLRLLAGAAQCAANLGDAAAAVDYLDQADRARASIGEDEVNGLFTFTAAKQSYYGASSLMWIPEPAALTRAVRDAEAAIEMWQGEGTATRSLDDERLAHVYAATAHVRLGHLDAAMQAVVPVLTLDVADRISWLRKRVEELAALIAVQGGGSSEASEAATALRDWAAGSDDTPTERQVTNSTGEAGHSP